MTLEAAGSYDWRDGPEPAGGDRLTRKGESMKRVALLACMSMLGATATLVLGAQSASAEYGNLAEYQIAFSQNCNNPDFCIGEGLGGSWGWAVLNNDGTGDLQITFCGHEPGVGGGAGHEDVDIYAWHEDEAKGIFVVDSASDPDLEGDSPIPSEPGHYNMHPAPGVNIEIVVAEIPNR
jgi:hypothetical protein